MSVLSEGLEKVKRLLLERGEPNTDPQRRWVERLQNTERHLVEATKLEEEAAASQNDEKLQRRLVIRSGQATLALNQVVRGTESHRRNYDEAHGGTAAERRAGWNQAYADRMLKLQGRIVRKNKKRADMTPEEWAAHEREKGRIAKAKQRAKKDIDPD